MPLIKTKKALNDLGTDCELSVLADNVESIENIEKMIGDIGYPYIKGKAGDNFVITIIKSEAGRETIEGSGILQNNIVNEASRINNSVIVVSSDKMGDGDDELGSALLKTFLYTLTESETLPKAIIFYNNGVKITVGGSASLDAINTLAKMGVDILSCGACLNYYGLTDSLKAGRVSNMYEIAGFMLNASNVVTL